MVGGVVFINNPYDNREELYDWGTFQLSVTNSTPEAIEIIRDENPNQPYECDCRSGYLCMY
jgi:hypothetical protein